MIRYVTGSLGAGKSLYAARIIARSLLAGKVVATNIHLVPGWEDIVLSRAWFYKTARADKKERYRDEIATRYAYVPEIWNLLGARLRGRGEGRGVMVLDEAHNEINNREWAEKNQTNALRKLTLARKRGWHTYIISQHKDNTDAAARRIATTEIRLLNWRQVAKVPVIGLPIIPFHMFLAQEFLTNQNSYVLGAEKKVSSEVFFLGWFKDIYDTFEDFDGNLGEDPEALWLPRRGMVRPVGEPSGRDATRLAEDQV